MYLNGTWKAPPSSHRRRSSYKCAASKWEVWGTISALCFLLGCARQAVSNRSPGLGMMTTNPIQISMEVARSIAKQEAEKVCKGEYEVHDPELVEGSYWRIVVQSTYGGKGCNLTNVLSGALSKSQAETVATAQAKLELGAVRITVISTEPIPGPFWRVLVWQLPAVPEGSFLLDVSSRDGTVVSRF